MKNKEYSGQAAVFKGAGQPIEIGDFNLRALRQGEILVRNLYTTLCGSDIHTYCGMRNEPCPTVLGHEIVGGIIEIESHHSGVDHNGQPLQAGDVVTWSVFASDPRSYNALRGIPQKGTDLFKYGHALVDDDDPFHGGLSEYCILRPHTAVLKIPSVIPIPVAATLNCAIATAAGAVNMAGYLEGKNVLIFGAGMLGVCCAAMCKEAGASWIGAVDLSAKRLEESIHFGVNDVFVLQAGKDQPVLKQVRDRLGGKGADVVFDMSGSPEAMEAGVELLAIGGSAIWIGAVFDNRKVQIDAQYLIRNLLTIKGLHNYNHHDFKYALDFLHRNWSKYPFDTIIEKEFELKDAEKAFEYALAHKPLRVGVRIGY